MVIFHEILDAQKCAHFKRLRLDPESEIVVRLKFTQGLRDDENSDEESPLNNRNLASGSESFEQRVQEYFEPKFTYIPKRG